MANMPEYKYVPLDIKSVFGARSENHREIISLQAELGYKYVGFIPTVINGEGLMKKIDLIFERWDDSQV